jgi:uncharacterized DUF497 family protein
VLTVQFDALKNAENFEKHGLSLKRLEAFDFETALFNVDDSQERQVRPDAGRAVLRTLGASRGGAVYLRFQRTPSFESSMRIPFSSSSLRMASARAKLRVRLACVRSATSLSMASSVSERFAASEGSA